jgi:Na+/melibiose symporter-like transporter
VKHKRLSPRIIYCLCGLIIVLGGVASRVFHSGFALLDHDLGEALYAALAYVLLGIVWPQLLPPRKALITTITMAVIEAFQLTGVPARFAASGNILLKLLAVVLGTTWSWRDLLGYAVGIAVVALLDYLFWSGSNNAIIALP